MDFSYGKVSGMSDGSGNPMTLTTVCVYKLCVNRYSAGGREARTRNEAATGV